jgi:hypothetical protein
MLSAILLAASFQVAAASDCGPRADVAAVRAAERRAAPSAQIAQVRVVGNYAMVRWDEGDASGVALFKRASGAHWVRRDSTGGIYDVGTLVGMGVPAATARRLLNGANMFPKSSPC